MDAVIHDEDGNEAMALEHMTDGTIRITVGLEEAFVEVNELIAFFNDFVDKHNDEKHNDEKHNDEELIKMANEELIKMANDEKYNDEELIKMANERMSEDFEPITGEEAFNEND